MQDLIQDFPHTDPLPALFISHAAPVLLMKPEDLRNGQYNDCNAQSDAANWYRSLPAQLGLVGDQRPVAIVHFSAHYEPEELDTVEILCSNTYNGLLYDYNRKNWPAYTFDFQYPAPGHVNLAKYIQHLLQQVAPSDIDVILNTERGIDHGTSIPTSLMYPEADIPIIQISILEDAKLMRQLGEALAPLRSRGVLIGGSGQFTHNSSVDPQGAIDQSYWMDTMTEGMSFDEKKSVEENYQKASAVVDNWDQIRGGVIAHPRFDHYVPLPTVVGMTKGNEKDRMVVLGDFWLSKRHSLRSMAWAESLPFVDTKKRTNTTTNSTSSAE